MVYAYGWGSVWVKNSSGRWMRSDTDDTPRYNLQRSAIVASLTDSLENGNLPRNGAGATYGSMLMKDVTGEIPELIAARGTNGEMGYIKQSDLFADYDDAKRVGRTGRSIPLYDVDGEEIGAFLIRFNDSTEIIGKNIDEVRAELTDGRSEDPILWDLAEKSLVNGAYPVNENGETYGHPMLRNLVGYPPALMAAIGTDGQEGYVRTSDLSHPKFKTPQEALEWQLSQPDSYDIPLCDFQGNEIGSFRIECNTLTISEMEALKTGKAN